MKIYLLILFSLILLSTSFFYEASYLNTIIVPPFSLYGRIVPPFSLYGRELEFFPWGVGAILLSRDSDSTFLDKLIELEKRTNTSRTSFNSFDTFNGIGFPLPFYGTKYVEDSFDLLNNPRLITSLNEGKVTLEELQELKFYISLRSDYFLPIGFLVDFFFFLSLVFWIDKIFIWKKKK